MNRLLPIFFFTIYFIFGALHVADFGISTDEAMNNQNARVSARFVLEKVMPDWAFWYKQHSKVYLETPELLFYRDKFYGVAFDLPIFILQKSLHINDPYDRFRFKHFCTFLLCFIGSIYFYRIIKHLHNRVDWAILGTLFFILHPRLFAESFYNPKDLPLMASFVISFYYLLKFSEQKTGYRAVQFALISAFTIDIRILGVLLPIAAVGLFCYDGLLAAGKFDSFKTYFQRFRRAIPYSFWVFIATLLCAIIGFCPLLWHRPLFFFDIFSYMSHYPWEHKTHFMGLDVFAPNNPWYFSITWIGITTPFLYTLFWVFGLIKAIAQVYKNKGILYQNSVQKANIAAIMLSFAPLLLIILNHSVLYDGWRQLYFLYPAACILAINAFASLGIEHKYIRKYALPVFFCLAILHSCFQIGQTYPYSNIYFNSLVRQPELRYEVDYWGLSYRSGQRRSVFTVARFAYPAFVRRTQQKCH